MVNKLDRRSARLVRCMGFSINRLMAPPVVVGCGCALIILSASPDIAFSQPVSWPKKESPYAPRPLPSAPFGAPREADEDVAEPSLDTPTAGRAPIEKSQSAPASTLKLQAGISHSETMPPVPSWQRPGKVFRMDASTWRLHSSSNLSHSRASSSSQPSSRFILPGVKRFRVPDWMAGVWQRSDAKEVSRIELPGGKKLRPVGNQVARVKDVFGTYRDASGQVWQTFNPQKAIGQVDRGLSMDYHQVHSYDLVITGPRSVVVEVRATHIMVSKANRRIAKVYQDEELNKYTLAPDGKLITDSSVKVFDLEGRPFLLTRTTSSEIRIPPRVWPPRLNSSAPRN